LSLFFGLNLCCDVGYFAPSTLELPIHNNYSNIGSSHVWDENNDTKVGMDDYIQYTHALEVILFMHCSKMSKGMMFISLIPSSKSKNLFPPPLSLGMGQDLPN
jgi:hypothetical protein